MNLYKNQSEQLRELVQAPDWYLNFDNFKKARLLGLSAIQAAMRGNIIGAAYQAREMIFETFADLLDKDDVALGNPLLEQLENLDANRKQIDTLVIHHSSRAEGLPLKKLNAMHLLNVYIPAFKASPDQHSIYSGHFDETGRQVFYGYHWMVKQDGSSTRLLDDSALAWHAGNYEINKRSIGICIDDDLVHKSPTPDSLETVVEIIKDNYPDIKISEKTIIGHNEAIDGRTLCPGDKFLSGWKNQLLERLS